MINASIGAAVLRFVVMLTEYRCPIAKFHGVGSVYNRRMRALFDRDGSGKLNDGRDQLCRAFLHSIPL